MRDAGDGARGVMHQILEIQRAAPHHEMTGVRARQQEEVIDDTRQPPRGILDDRHRFTILRLLAMVARQRDVRLGTDDGGRCAQFVRCVGDESALLIERILESVEQAVDDGREADQFIAATDGQALVHVADRDRGCLRGHRGDRRQAAARERIAAERRSEQQQRNREQEHGAHPLQHIVDVAQRVGAAERVPMSANVERTCQHTEVASRTGHGDGDRGAVCPCAQRVEQCVLDLRRRPAARTGLVVVLLECVHRDDLRRGIEDRDVQFAEADFRHRGAHCVDHRHARASFRLQLT